MMFCRKCRKEIPEGSAFCNFCGKKQQPEKRKTHRRAKGMGTIRYDPRYKSPWIAVAPPLIKGTNGDYIGAFKTKREAEQAQETYRNGKFPDLYNADLAQIYELWSVKHFENLASDNGRSGYKAAFADLAPLHSRKMRELKTADFQVCIDTVAAKYSRSKCEKVKQLCSQLCKYAMQNDLMDKNYAQFLSLPQIEKKEKVTFTENELKTLWEHSDDNRVRFILFMIYTGFRIGEVSELSPTIENIHAGFFVGGIKTEAGKNRIVPLPPDIPEIKKWCSEWILAPKLSPFGVPKNSLRQYWFYPALSELGMIDPPIYNDKTRKNDYKNPRITPHATRHTFASLAAAAGMRPDDLQKIIGHADYATTADIYIHQNIETLITAMSKLSK